MKKLTVGSCFSGIGGLELGLEWTGGFETKWQIEIDPYATKVLEKHWPGVERFSDITTVAHPPAVDVICGGFPCQDVSLAGARAGLEGKRSTLWSELFRLVCEVRPRWLLAENVPGLLSSDGGRFFGNILRDLADVGFDAEWRVLSAAGVGARHLRRRVFLLANSRRQRGQRWREARDMVSSTRESQEDSQEWQRNGDAVVYRSSNVANAQCKRLPSRNVECSEPPTVFTAACDRNSGGSEFGQVWRIEPDVGRVAYGISSAMDRLRCLGNAVVPQVAQKIGEMILEYERRKP